MSFAHPQILWLLLVFPPALVAFFWWSWRTRQKLMTQFIGSRLLAGLVAGISPLRQKIRLGCLVMAIVCLIVALARPQWGFTWEEVKQRGVDIVVAIDTSKSMLAQDIAPNRLARAKLAAIDLMRLAKSDRLGLVAFAGDAFLSCPLTIDDAAFRQSVEGLDVHTLPQGGTALAEAIETAQTAFKEGENHKVLVLMTDGEDHDSGALEAAGKAAQSGLRIFTIGIGTVEGELLRIKDAQGQDDYIRDEQGNVVKSHLDEQLLREIAGKSEGGFYLPLRGTKAIDTLYNEGLAKLPKSEHQQKLVKQYYDRYHWPLAVGIVFLLIEMLLPERKRQPRVTPGDVAVPGRPAAVAAAVLVLLLLLPASVSGSPSSALREYKAGKYDEALKEYEKLLERKTDDPRLHFNAGTAAYGSRQFDEAVKQFNEAVGSPDLKLQELAYYNRGNALYRLGEKSPDPKQRTEAWQKALKDYELSMKLDPKDADAKFNHEFVKKRLEELKQQQQQKDKSDQQNQDQNQQQNQDRQDQQKQDQQKQDQQQQQQQQQKEQKQDSAQQTQQEQQKQQQQPQSQEQKDQQANQAKEKEKEEAEEKERQAAYAAGQMTAEQAQQLLDAQKGEEKMLPVKPENKPVDTSRPFKDW
jgi:Ca-activated chloride channel family protein